MGKANSPPPANANEIRCTDDDGHVSTGAQDPSHPVPTKGAAVPIEEALKVALVGKSNTTKMPVSLLYELLGRQGVIPQYELLPIQGGGSHSPTFRYRVACPDGDAIGWGQSKKEAKHAAARILMDKLGLNCTASRKVLGRKTPISVLQEVLCRRELRPQYDFIQCEKNGYKKTFHYRVWYEDKEGKAKVFEAVGTGKSKKDAKQAAAKALIDKLAGYAFWDTHAYDSNSRNGTTDENVGSPRDDPNTDDDGTCLDENTEPERGAKRQSEQTLANIFEPQWKRRSTEKGFAVSKNATI
nr:interferon-inducible double-stranded RNA-dependent protein kinase activator A homolog isoform X1 [Aedes albopictus]